MRTIVLTTEFQALHFPPSDVLRMQLLLRPKIADEDAPKLYFFAVKCKQVKKKFVNEYVSQALTGTASQSPSEMRSEQLCL